MSQHLFEIQTEKKKQNKMERWPRSSAQKTIFNRLVPNSTIPISYLTHVIIELKILSRAAILPIRVIWNYGKKNLFRIKGSKTNEYREKNRFSDFILSAEIRLFERVWTLSKYTNENRHVQSLSTSWWALVR